MDEPLRRNPLLSLRLEPSSPSTLASADSVRSRNPFAAPSTTAGSRDGTGILANGMTMGSLSHPSATGSGSTLVAPSTEKLLSLVQRLRTALDEQRRTTDALQKDADAWKGVALGGTSKFSNDQVQRFLTVHIEKLEKQVGSLQQKMELSVTFSKAEELKNKIDEMNRENASLKRQFEDERSQHQRARTAFERDRQYFVDREQKLQEKYDVLKTTVAAMEEELEKRGPKIAYDRSDVSIQCELAPLSSSEPIDPIKQVESGLASFYEEDEGDDDDDEDDDDDADDDADNDIDEGEDSNKEKNKDDHSGHSSSDGGGDERVSANGGSNSDSRSTNNRQSDRSSSSKRRRPKSESASGEGHLVSVGTSVDADLLADAHADQPSQTDRPSLTDTETQTDPVSGPSDESNGVVNKVGGGGGVVVSSSSSGESTTSDEHVRLLQRAFLVAHPEATVSKLFQPKTGMELVTLNGLPCSKMPLLLALISIGVERMTASPLLLSVYENETLDSFGALRREAALADQLFCGPVSFKSATKKWAHVYGILFRYQLQLFESEESGRQGFPPLRCFSLSTFHELRSLELHECGAENAWRIRLSKPRSKHTSEYLFAASSTSARSEWLRRLQAVAKLQKPWKA